MSKFLYHPAGDYAQHYIDADIPVNNFPRTYASHGYGKIDWALPHGQPIYSMTDGYVTTLKDCIEGKDGCDGYTVCIKSDRQAYCVSTGNYQTVYMSYIEMGGLSDRLAKELGVSTGKNTWSATGATKTYTSDTLKIEQGELIGYANSRRDYSTLHTDWTFNDRWGSGRGSPAANFENVDTIPQVQSSRLDENFSVKSNHISFKGEELGVDGTVPQEGGAKSRYSVYPYYHYISVLQTPTKIVSENGEAQTGGIQLDRSVYNNTRGTDDNATAADFYFNGTISTTFMGDYPSSLDKLNGSSCKGIRRICQSCKNEFGDWPFGRVSYAKLYRATIIGNSYVNSVTNGATNLEEWLAKAYAGRTDWMGGANTGNISYTSEKDLKYAQAIYNNLRYPGLYGADLHTGSEKFKQAIIKAASGIPLHNGWVNYTWATPPAFAVLFNTVTDTDEGTSGTPRSGVYLLYRGKSGDFNIFNSIVKG